MINSYVDLYTLKSIGVMNVTTSGYDSRLLRLAESVSRQADRFCNRHFFYTVETKTFDGNGSKQLLVPDLLSVSQISEDDNGDGTYDTVWGTDDFLLYPRTSNPTANYGNARPYTSLVISQSVSGTQEAFNLGQSNYQITGTWGYQKVSQNSGLNGTLADGTGTSLVLSGSVTGVVEAGHTLLLDNELMYVTQSTGTSATVIRGVNGSTGTAHAGVSVQVVEYPGPVVEAVIIQVSRLWRRKDSAFAHQIGLPQTGEINVFAGGIDQDIKALLGAYRKIPI